jgi:DNA processing protein
MGARRTSDLSDERLALLGLWAVPGIGPKTIASIEDRYPDLGSLLREPFARWGPMVEMFAPARGFLQSAGSLEPLAHELVEHALAAKMEIAFQGDEAYPQLLTRVGDAPPLLFFQGRVNTPRRRLAMVGTRRPDGRYADFAASVAAQLARAGVGVVSGAADGIDRASHLGAIKAGGETWAFLGSALDQVDPSQASLRPQILDAGGTVYSELPPGIRADKSTFPRRNRLISGSCDAVLVVRAGEGSGALHTARYAEAQGRPVLAFPGELSTPNAAGCNKLINEGKAKLCLNLGDIFEALGDKAARAHIHLERPQAQELKWDGVTPDAKRAYDLLGRAPVVFEDLMAQSALTSAKLTSALCELELMGLIVQHPGKRYERV